LDYLKPDDPMKAIALIAGGGIAIFILGYVIGTFTYLTLRLAFRVKASLFGGSKYHEVALSDAAVNNVWKRLGATGTWSREQELFAVIAFDHGILYAEQKGIHLWTVRRWTAFSIATTSIAGLLWSLVVAYLVGIKFRTEWWVPVAFFVVLLCFSARLAWRG